jgi:hypothetical protein
LSVSRRTLSENNLGAEIPNEIKARGPFDLIVGSDLLYKNDEDLLKTLVDLSTPGKTEVVLTYAVPRLLLG